MRLRQRTGVDRNATPTSSAAATPSTFLNCVGRLDALQEQLGHRDINTTRIYLRLTGEDVVREVAKGELQLPLLAGGQFDGHRSRAKWHWWIASGVTD